MKAPLPSARSLERHALFSSLQRQLLDALDGVVLEQEARSSLPSASPGRLIDARQPQPAFLPCIAPSTLITSAWISTSSRLRILQPPQCPVTAARRRLLLAASEMLNLSWLSHVVIAL